MSSIDTRWQETDEALLTKCCPEYSSLVSAIARMRTEASEAATNLDAVFDRVRSSAAYAELGKGIGQKLDLLNDIWSELGRS